MENEYSSFLERPIRENYLRVQQLVLASRAVDDGLHRLIELIKSEQFDEAIDLQDEMGATWLLSPSFHLWSAKLAERINDPEGVELEQFQFKACLTGLLSTGDGGPQSPFSATYISDIRDVLTFFETEPTTQQVVQKPEGVFDLVTCDDGKQRYFARPELSKARNTRVRPSARNASLAN